MGNDSSFSPVAPVWAESGLAGCEKWRCNDGFGNPEDNDGDDDVKD